MPLHAHPDPSTLLPLLRTQLPASLVFLGTLMSNPCLSPVYANFPPRSDGEIDAAYLSSLGIGEYEWLVTVALPAPSEQLRVHHALSGAPPDLQEQNLSAASEAVCAAIEEMMQRYPAQPVLGAVPELFGPSVRQLLDAPKLDTTYIYAPAEGWGDSSIDAPSDLAGLTFDIGRPEDGQAFHDFSGYRSLDYYRERSGCATVLRDAEGKVQVWVFTHGDGSIGALYAMPAYRRKGLAKAVLRRHVDRETQRGIPRFCYIEEDNDASASLFSSFGWTRLEGEYGWIYNSASLKREGKA